MKVYQRVALFLFVIAADSVVADGDTKQRFFQPDGEVWVTFYDLPSRRFRRIRDAFLIRNFDAAAADLVVAKNYIGVEANRADERLAPDILDVVDSMEHLASRLHEPTVTVGDFDPLFARAHWLLSQHYLLQAMAARDQNDLKLAGWNLHACAHHMERSALWSNARISVGLVSSLDEIRALGNRMLDSPGSRWVDTNQPIVKAAKTLRRLGKELNRPVKASTRSKD